MSFGESRDIRGCSWREYEVRSALPLVGGGSLERTREVLSMVETLGQTDPALFHTVQEFIFHTNSQQVVDWISVAFEFPERDQTRNFLAWAMRKTFDLKIPSTSPKEFDPKGSENERRKGTMTICFSHS